VFIYCAYADRFKPLNSMPKMCFHGEGTSPFSLINCLAYDKNTRLPQIVLWSYDSGKCNSDSAAGLANKTSGRHLIEKMDVEHYQRKFASLACLWYGHKANGRLRTICRTYVPEHVVGPTSIRRSVKWKSWS